MVIWIENHGENLYKMPKICYTFWWNIIPTLGLCISGTKCDRDKLIFSAERSVNMLRYKIGTQSDWKSPKLGSSPQNLPTMPKYGSTPSRYLPSLPSLPSIQYKCLTIILFLSLWLVFVVLTCIYFPLKLWRNWKQQ